MMATTLKRFPDPLTVNGWAYWFRYAYGGFAPLKFSGLKYGGKIPTSNVGLTFQILIKNARTDLDTAAIVNDAVQGSFTFLSSPLIIGYQLDTAGIIANGGFAKGKQYPGELWVQDVDALYERQLANEFLVDLSTPQKDTFGSP
jgi:hypothetical protein